MKLELCTPFQRLVLNVLSQLVGLLFRAGEKTLHGELVNPKGGGKQTDDRFILRDVGKVTVSPVGDSGTPLIRTV